MEKNDIQKSLTLIGILITVLVIGLSTTDSSYATDMTGPWTNTGGGVYNSTADTVNVSASATGSWSGVSTGTTTSDTTFFSNSSAANHNSLQSTFANSGVITFRFSTNVTNPVLHIDRIGGAAGGSSTSASFTVTSGQTLQKLSGPNHLVVGTNTFYRTPGQPTSGTEASWNSAFGTAAGSIRFIGTFDTVTLAWTSIGSSNSDQLELVWELECPRANLGVTKVDSPDPVVAGNQLTYTVTVRNSGPSTIRSSDTFFVVDTLPAGFTATSFTPSAGSYTSTNGAWTGVTLASGQSVTLTILGTVSPSATGTLTNTVTVTPPAGWIDPFPANNTASSSTVVNRVADLGVTKVDSPDPVVAGNQLTYTVTVRNSGPSTIRSSDTFFVVDVLPAGFTATSFTPSAGSYTSTNGAWTGVTLASGQSVTLTILGTVSPSATGTLTNTVTVTPPTGVTDPFPANNTASSSTVVNRVADLGVTKVDSPDPVVAGNQLTYTVTVRNSGPSTIRSSDTFTVSDVLPAGFTATSFTPSAGSYTSTNGAWTGVTLASGQSVTLTILGTVSPSATGTLTNTVTVTPPTGVTDPFPANNTASSSTVVNRVADLGVTKVDSPDPVVAGNQLTYTVTVTNNGPSTILSSDTFTVSDVLPVNFAAMSWNYPGNYNPGTGAWTGVTLASGQSVTLTIVGTVNPTATGSLTNTATVTAPAGVTDPNPSNNQATTTTTVTPRSTDLAISKADIPDPVVAGNQLTYTVTVTNNGPSTILSSDTFTVSDVLPAGFTATSFTPSAGSYTSGTGAWTGVTLASGQSVTLTIVGTVSPSATGTLTNTVTVTPPAGVIEPNPTNNQATATTTINRVADLAISKADIPDPVVAGNQLTYTVTVTNNGPSTILSSDTFTVSDVLPAGFTATSFTPSAGSYTSGTGAWRGVTLASGQSVTLTILGTVSPDAAGTLSNTATVTPPAGVTDPNPNNNAATSTTTVNRAAAMTVTKNADQANYNVGDTVTYNLIVTNNGPSSANNVVVTDTVPTGLTFVSATNGGTESGGVVTWTVPYLAVNGQFTPSFTATVNAGTQGQTIPNTASAYNTENPTPVTSNPANIYVNYAVLSVNKVANQTNYNVGNTVLYDIGVFNSGPDAATNVLVTDTLPNELTFVSATNGGVWDLNARTITWNIANLAANDGLSLSVTATVNAGTQGTNPQNTVTVTSDQGSTDQETETITINNAPLTITKTTDKAQYNVGETVTYTINVTNGVEVNTATGVVVTDTLPAGLTFVSASNGGVWDPSTRTITWNVGNLDSGATFAPTVTATVTSDAAAKTLVNNATADAEQLDQPVTTTASIYVPSADLVLTKTVDKTKPTVKDTVVFTLIVNNHGPDTAVDVTVFDKLPAGVTYVSSSANYGTYDPATGLWSIASLPNGASAVLTITAVVDESGQIVNQANVTALTWDPNLEGNTASAAMDVQKKVEPVPVNGKTVKMQKTGAPIVGLLLAFFMLLAGMVLPRRK